MLLSACILSHASASRAAPRALLQAPVGVAGPAVGAADAVAVQPELKRSIERDRLLEKALRDMPDAVAVQPEPAPAAANAEEDEFAALEADMAQ